MIVCICLKHKSKMILVVKDCMTGLVWAKLTKDQTSDEAFKAIVEWCHRYGLPHSVRSDGAGSLCSRFREKVREIGVEHTLTSPYNSESNGGSEQHVRFKTHPAERRII